MQKKQQDVAAPILGKLQGLVRKIALRDNVDIVFDRQATPYARPELDVTDQIIVMYNAGEASAAEPAKSGAPATSAAPPAPAPAASGTPAPPPKK